MNRQLTIRVGNGTLSFSMADTSDREHPITYEPFVVKSGISMAANMREALKTSPLPASLSGEKGLRVRLMVNSQPLLVPVEQFQVADAETLYTHSFSRSGQMAIVYNVLPSLNAVAIFGVNKDLLNVVNDCFADVQLIHAVSPVWNYLHQRSFSSHRNKLYAYFHDGQLDIFSFQQNRFKFCNTFDATHSHDALYFLLYVWKQLNLQPDHDELHLVGDIPEREWLIDELRQYLQKAYIIHPSAEFNRAPATKIDRMPFDLITLFTKGR